MLAWFKRLFAIVRNYSAEIAQLNARIELLKGRLAANEQVIRERTDIAVDVGYSHRDMNTIITVGRFRGCDYVQTYQVSAGDFTELIDRLRSMERHGVVRRIDAPPHIVGAFKRDLQY